MATVTYHRQSFNVEPWQDMVDFNAELIEVPLGTISDSLQGFAFLNADGTYTAVLGTDITIENGVPSIHGTAELISRRSTLDPFSTIYTTVEGSFSPSLVYASYRSGGDHFERTLFSGFDTVEIVSPASLGALSESPLIETDVGDDVVHGSIYDDTIYAQQGDDEVDGDNGDDTIYGGDGQDRLSGGGGRDTIFGGDHADNIRGGDGMDTIDGGSGNDTIRGDEGHDTIEGGDGNDTIRGGEGNDEILGQSGTDTLYGGNGTDTIRGGVGGDTIEGGEGGDFIFGGDGADTILAQEGDDFVFADAGNDDIRGGQGFDLMLYEGNREDYRVRFEDDVVFVIDQVGDGGTDTLRGFEQIHFNDGVIIV